MKCTCVSGFGNTGTPACQAIFDVTKYLILVPYFKSDGTINGIDLDAMVPSEEMNQAFIDSKVQSLNPLERWYPTPELKNIEDVRAEDIFETFEDGTGARVQDGPRTFVGQFVGQSAQFKGQLDAARCKIVGYYAVDKSGNFIGDNSRDGFLDPIRIQKDSIAVGLVKGTDTTIQKVSLGFTVDQLMDDANLSMIESGNISGQIAGINGLLDVILDDPATSIVTTGFSAKLDTIYGGVFSKTPALGLEVTDFVAFNDTQSAALPLVSVTETSDGVYDFVYVAVASADVISITNKTAGILDKGYDVAPFTVTTP